MDLQREVSRLQQDLAQLRAQVKVRDPATNPAPGFQRMLIGGTNGSYNKAITSTPYPSNVRGAKWTATPLTTLAVAYNPYAPALITDDGICYADNITTGELVLVFTAKFAYGFGYVGGKVNTDLIHTTPASSGFVEVVALRRYPLPGPSNTTVMAWEAFAIG